MPLLSQRLFGCKLSFHFLLIPFLLDFSFYLCSSITSSFYSLFHPLFFFSLKLKKNLLSASFRQFEIVLCRIISVFRVLPANSKVPGALTSMENSTERVQPVFFFPLWSCEPGHAIIFAFDFNKSLFGCWTALMALRSWENSLPWLGHLKFICTHGPWQQYGQTFFVLLESIRKHKKAFTCQ